VSLMTPTWTCCRLSDHFVMPTRVYEAALPNSPSRGFLHETSIEPDPKVMTAEERARPQALPTKKRRIQPWLIPAGLRAPSLGHICCFLLGRYSIIRRTMSLRLVGEGASDDCPPKLHR